MRRIALGLSTAALLAACGFGATTASAAPLSGAAAIITDAGMSTVDKVDYYYDGRNYCWYYDGWHGPGWYWCGYAWRRGYGWGSPVYGWRGWAWGGPRYRPGIRSYRGGGGGPRGGHGHH